MKLIGSKPVAAYLATTEQSTTPLLTTNNALASNAAFNAIAQGAVLEAIASYYVEQTVALSGITQPIANLTERIVPQPAGLLNVMTQLDTVISNRLQKLDVLKTNLEKERSDRATEALSNYVNSSSVESALGETVSSLVEQLFQYRQQLATDKIALKSCEQLINRLTTDRAISAIANHVEFKAIDNSKLIPALESLAPQLSPNKTPLTIALAQLNTVVSNYLTELKATVTVLEQKTSEQAISTVSNYVNSSSVESALGETVASLVEQFSQYRQQLATDKNNSSINMLLNRLELVSNSKQEAKLHTKDLQEAQTQAEARSHSNSANESSSDWLPIRNEEQWSQVRRYLVEQRCLPTQLVDRLATAGKVYADSSGNAVFLHTASQGRITGATIFDIKSEVLNCQLAPRADNGVGYFQLSQGKDKLSRIVLTDSPLEAISLAALERGQYKNRTLYIDINERQDNPELQNLLDSGVGVEVAFSAEGASETRARQIVDSFPGVIRSKPAHGFSWNEQLRSKSKSKNSKPVEKKRLLPALRSAQSHTQKFDPNQQILLAIQLDRVRYKSDCQSDLKTAIDSLVAGRSLEELRQEIASSSVLVKHWQEQDRASTLATAKTIQYVEQLWEEVEANPFYYQKLYHKYLKDMQKTHGHLPRTDLDKLVASAALQSHPVSSVKSILKYSLAAQVGDGEYIPQILAEVWRQEQSVQEPQQHEKIKTYEPRGFEFGD